MAQAPNVDRGPGDDSRQDRWKFAAMLAVRIAGILITPLLDHWYGGDGSGRHL